MSLINKMLQDLEQRHADESTGRLPPEVRAAPAPQGARPWIMIAALCCIVLCGLAVWMGLRPRAVSTPAAQQPVQAVPAVASATPVVVPAAAPPESPVASTPALSLKVDGDLSTASLSQIPPMTESVAPTEQATKANKGTDKPNGGQPVAAHNLAEPAQEKGAQQANTQDKQVQIKPVAAAQSPRAEPKALTDTVGKNAATEQSVALNKQVKEWTPQQKAENDYRKATTLIQQGRAQEASTLLEQVLQTDPSNASARQTLIALMLNAKRRDDAMHLAQQGLELDMRQTNFAMILARLQLDKGDQKAAIATLQRSLPASGSNAEYQAFLAALMQREGRHADAINLYEAALDKDPGNGVWWMGLGISLQADNRLQPAREAFMHARETASLSSELQAFVEQKIRQLSR
jgi:MSHA biogenesis protein MshN